MDQTSPLDFNPYTAPSSAGESEAPPEVVDPGAEAIRREHFGRESTIRAMGLGCYMIAAFMALLAAGGVVTSAIWIVELSHRPHRPGWLVREILVQAGISFVLAPLTAGTFALARGLRRFRPGARRACLVVVSILLLVCAVFVLASPLIEKEWFALSISWAVVAVAPASSFWLLKSAKGRTIFTPEYRDVVARTPHIKYRASRRLKVGLLLTLVLILVAVGISILWNLFA